MRDLQYLRLAGRCADGAERGKGSLFHAVEIGKSAALCGAKPGRHSAGWSFSNGVVLTCQKCIRKLQLATV